VTEQTEKGGGGHDDTLARRIRRFEIASRVAESDIVTSFVLRPLDGAPPAPHIAGQHLTLFAHVPGAGRQKRNYTISRAPNGEHYRISVKREEQGTVSKWLHDVAQPGTVLEIAPPSGSFVLPSGDERPLVLISAGVGLTPMVAMLEELVATGRKGTVQFIHCNRDRAAHAFRDHVRELAAAQGRTQVTTLYSRPGTEAPGEGFDIEGHLTLDWLVANTPISEGEYFLCGPLGFLRSFVPALAKAGVPMGRLHYEFFGPVDDLFGEESVTSDPKAAPAVAIDAREARAASGFTREAIGAALIDSAADSIVASDAKGDIVLWNAGSQRIFGFTEDEALGQSLDIIIPEPFRARHWEGYHETVASGESRYGAGDMLAVPGLHKDGRRLSIEFTIVLLKDEGGRVTGMVASVRDVTARFEETKALKKKLAALETDGRGHADARSSTVT